MNLPKELSNSLKPIAQYELDRGNQIERIDKPAGSQCPLAVIFERPLDFDGFGKTHDLSNHVSTWKNRDRHYPIEDGYLCEVTRHVLAGPALNEA